MDQALFEGFVTRDPLGFFLVGPPDALEQHGHFSEHMFREFATFLVEKYDAVVIDGGRAISNEVVLAAAQVSAAVFLVIDQEFPSIRNAQRYITFLMRMGFNQDQIKVVVNRYTKKVNTNQASLEQIQQTLNQTVFYGIPPSPAVLASINRAGRSWPIASRPATWTASSAPSWTRRPAQEGKAAEAGGEDGIMNRHDSWVAEALSVPARAPTAGSSSRARSTRSC